MWTEQEIEVLKREYGTKLSHEIDIPGRLPSAIRRKASSLGLKCDLTLVSENASIKSRLYDVHHEYFSILNIENYYWAGFFAADGMFNE
jgi:hypothetical protein